MPATQSQIDRCEAIAREVCQIKHGELDASWDATWAAIRKEFPELDTYGPDGDAIFDHLSDSGFPYQS